MRFFGILVLSVLLSLPAYADDWPQWLGPKRDGIWREQGLIERFPERGPTVRWRVPIGAGYAGPAVANGKVFVMDRQLPKDGQEQTDPFARGIIKGSERILCFNEADGKPLWSHEYDCPYNISYASGPRSTPAIDGDRLYALGAEGHLTCLNINTGKPLWHKKLSSQEAPTPMWGFAGHPLVDGEKVICLTSGKAVTAFNKMTGDVLWSAIETSRDYGPGYSPPMIFEAGGKRQLIILTPERVVSLDPESGKEYWREKYGPVQNGVSIATPMKLGDTLVVSTVYGGTMALKLDDREPKATVLYKRVGDARGRKTDALQTLMSTPMLKDGHVYGICAGGELRCLDLKTGDRIWESLKPTTEGDPIMWTTAFLTPAEGDRFYIANDQGELIIANLTPKGYQELSRAKLIEPTNRHAQRPVVWCYPAYGNKSIYWRNDKEIICVSLAK